MEAADALDELLPPSDALATTLYDDRLPVFSEKPPCHQRRLFYSQC